MADPNPPSRATSGLAMRGAPGIVGLGAGERARESRALRAAALGFALIAGAGCIGPGLEPPYEDRSGGGPSAIIGSNGSAAGSTGSGDFGNPVGVNGPATDKPGTTTSPPAQPATPAPSGSAGGSAPQVMSPPTSGAAGAAGAGGMAAEPNDPTMSSDAGMAGATNPFGLDFVPSCSDESAQALMAGSVCTYPLPEGTAIAPDATRIALVSDGAFTLVERVAGPFDCALIAGGFYFDNADPPTSITLCPQSCLRAGAAAQMQVVLVQGCPPPAP